MAKSNKVFVLGVDGMDPRLAKKFLDAGKMPHFAKFLERGSAREDLVLLGGVPTITPPMWATLATGANPSTHGITCFWAKIQKNWIPWFITWTPLDVKLNKCGTLPHWKARRLSYGTGQEALGLQA